MSLKTILVLGFACFLGLGSLWAQDNRGKKGSLYLYWGWNWDAFTDADIRFKGEVGEQATMFFLDPAGNALEFKAFKDIGQLFAK